MERGINGQPKSHRFRIEVYFAKAVGGVETFHAAALTSFAQTTCVQASKSIFSRPPILLLTGGISNYLFKASTATIGAVADVGNGTRAGEVCLERVLHMMTRLVNDPMNSHFWGHRRIETNKIISISLPVPCVNQKMGFIRQGQLRRL